MLPTGVVVHGSGCDVAVKETVVIRSPEVSDFEPAERKATCSGSS